MAKKKKVIKKLEKRLAALENKTTTVKPIGYQQVLRNDDNDNDYEDCGYLSWVSSTTLKQ